MKKTISSLLSRIRNKQNIPDDLIEYIEREFDSKYYANLYHDITNSEFTPLEHYAFTGWLENRDPSPLFSTSHYLSMYRDVKKARVNPFYHYLKLGQKEGRWPLPKSSQEIEYGRLKDIISLGFDENYYKTNNPDVVAAEIDPLEHFIITGGQEGRAPSEKLCRDKCYEICKNEVCDGENPLYYYLVYGKYNFQLEPILTQKSIKQETSVDLPGQPTPKIKPPSKKKIYDVLKKGFDIDFYLSRYPDIKKAGVEPITHYILHGVLEGRNPNSEFQTTYYQETNQDVSSSGLNPFYHYLTSGKEEGRPSSPAGGEIGQTIYNLLSIEERVARWGVETEISPKCLDLLAKKLLKDKRELIISFGHDEYVNAVGGVQLCIAEEQEKFNQIDLNYLNISPASPLPVLARKNGGLFLVNVILNGSVLGTTSAADLTTELARLLGEGAVTKSQIIIHALHGHDLDEISKLAIALGLKSAFFWLHDYFSICPGFNLLRNDVSFCDAPVARSNACQICVYGEEREQHSLKVKELFNNIAMDILSPSQVALNLWSNKSDLPHKSREVIPHRSLGKPVHGQRVAHVDGHPLKIAYLGYPVFHKGWTIFTDLVQSLTDDDRYEFYHLGLGKQPNKNIIYIETRADANDMEAMRTAVIENGIDVVILCSTWPETFSLITYESVSAGALIITTKASGNIPAIVQSERCGCVCDSGQDVRNLFVNGDIMEMVKQHQESFGVRKLEKSAITANKFGASPPSNEK